MPSSELAISLPRYEHSVALTALFILYETDEELIAEIKVQNLDTGLSLNVGALVINGRLGSYRILIGKKRHSIILQANGTHALTDAWTSLGPMQARSQQRASRRP